MSKEEIPLVVLMRPLEITHRMSDGRPCVHCILNGLVEQLCSEGSGHTVYEVIEGLAAVLASTTIENVLPENDDKTDELIRHVTELFLGYAELSKQVVEAHKNGDDKKPTVRVVGHG